MDHKRVVKEPPNPLRSYNGILTLPRGAKSIAFFARSIAHARALGSFDANALSMVIRSSNAVEVTL